MNLYPLLSPVSARFGIFLLALVATVACAVLVTLKLPKSYTATMSLLIDAKQEQSLSAAPQIPTQERISYLQTQADIISSPRVSRKVVEALNLAEDPARRAEFDRLKHKGGSIEDLLAEDLLAGLKVRTSQSSLISISFSASNPKFAAAVADAFGKAYIDTVLELRVEPAREAAAWFDEQLRTLRANLQAKLRDYQTQLAHEALAGGNRSRMADGSPALRINPAREDPLIQKLEADLVNGETKLRELATRYGPNHPAYQSQLSENQSLRERFEAEMAKAVTALNGWNREKREWEQGLSASLAARRARMAELTEDRNELTVLRRDVESAERAYDTAMQRFVVSQVESRANQTSIGVLNAAAIPREPSSPKVRLNIALSIVAGTILGVGIATVLEISKRRVRSRQDLDNAFGVPMIASLSAWRPGGALPALARLTGPRRALPKPN